MNKHLAIDAEDITIAYHEKPVIWDVDFQVPPGIMMAIVGPNGAGKSTLLKGILGLIKLTAGKVSVFGVPYEKQRKLVGYVPDKAEDETP